MEGGGWGGGEAREAVEAEVEVVEVALWCVGGEAEEEEDEEGGACCLCCEC